MNRTEHLLVILNEECAEVAQRADKCLRFGSFEVQPGQALVNITRLFHEYADLVAAVEMVCDELSVNLPANFHERVRAKKAKVEHFLNYSRELGTLHDEAQAAEVTR